jgi:hypothetical protein
MTHATKNKTVATWLAFLGGSLGLHRFYLHGVRDVWAWAHAIPTALGWWGVDRMRTLGQDDTLSWWLLPWLGLVVAVTCLTAILYALTDTPRWNQRHNPQGPADHTAGTSNWLTIAALVFSLMLGTIALMATLAFGFQRYFETQVEAAKALSQSATDR